MLKRKLNYIYNKSFFCCALKPNIKKIEKKEKEKDSNVEMQIMLKKRSVSMKIYCPWIILESWYLDIASISLVWLCLLDSNV